MYAKNMTCHACQNIWHAVNNQQSLFSMAKRAREKNDVKLWNKSFLKIGLSSFHVSSQKNEC